MEDYETEENSTPDAALKGGIFLPLALIAAAFSIFLFSQISNLGQNASSMRWQGENLGRQIAAINESIQNLNALSKQREALVEQSTQLQARYTSLLTEILDLAQTDNDAKGIVEKYKISRQQNGESQAAPANR
jgi:predicted transcriptional regulator